MRKLNTIIHLITLKLLFTVGVFGDVKVYVMKGDSITLTTGDSEIPRDPLIVWTFGSEANIIAESKGNKVSLHGLERFRNILHMNDQNGDLTIKDMRKEHSGLYQVKIISDRSTIYKRFSVTVSFFGAADVSVVEGKPITLNTGHPEIPTKHRLVWTFGSEGTVIAKSNETKALVYGHDEKFRYRLRLNNGNGDLTISNTNKEHSGFYRVKLVTEKAIIYRRFSLTVTPTNSSLMNFMFKWMPVLSALVIGFLLLICCYRR